MKLPISWATKMPIPSSGLSTTGKGPRPDNGASFKGTHSRPDKRKSAQREAWQTSKLAKGNTLLTTSYCEGSVFHRPNRAAMIAERIEGGMQGGERAHSPSADHIVGHEAFGGPAHQGVGRQFRRRCSVPGSIRSR